MSQYLRIVRKGKLHTRIELPDHSTTQIPTDQLDQWSLVPEDERPPQPVNPNPQKRYIKILRKCKHNVRVQLPDWTTMLISVDDLPEWELVDSNNASADYVNENVAENLDEEIAEVFNSDSAHDSDSASVSALVLESADNSVSDEVKNDSDSEVCTAPDTPISFEDEVVENNVVEELPKETLELTPPVSDTSPSARPVVSTLVSLPKYRVINGYYFNSRSGWVMWLTTLEGIKIPFKVDEDKLNVLSASTENRVNLTASEIEDIQKFFDLSVDEINNNPEPVVENAVREPLILTPPPVEVKKRRGRPRKNPISDVVEVTSSNTPNDREIIDLSNPPVENTVSDNSADNSVDNPVEDKPKKKRGRKPKNAEGEAPSKPTSFRRSTNGLGTDHPYESVNMDYETVEYEDGVAAPF